ncbi:MAG: nuclear transport factor 2 family protein [Bacteroidetes bacterium]|nr:nuclear transport factor 2 family protein [Bacteroidota bacterium]
MKKTRLTLIPLVIVLAIFTLPAYTQSKESEKLKSQIEKMNDKMVKAIKADDHEILSNMYVEDVYSLPSYSPMTNTKQAMIDHEMKNQEAGYKMVSMKFDVVEVIPAGDYAIEIGKYNVSMQVPMMEEPMNDKGKYITVWEKQKDGSLKIKAETWNTDANPWMDGMGHDNDGGHMDGREK